MHVFFPSEEKKNNTLEIFSSGYDINFFSKKEFFFYFVGSVSIFEQRRQLFASAIRNQKII